MEKTLWEAYRNYFPVGAAVPPLSTQTHQGLIVKHFASVTAETK